MTKFTISLLVANKHGVLTRVSGLFAKKGYNIDNLSVGKTENPLYSRMTIVTECENELIEQIVNQLEKLVDVKAVMLFDGVKNVSRELMLVKVKSSGQNDGVIQAVNVFRAKIIDLTPESLIIEITGETDKLDAFLEYLKTFEILEISRTGLTALQRGKAVINGY